MKTVSGFSFLVSGLTHTPLPNRDRKGAALRDAEGGKPQSVNSVRECETRNQKPETRDGR
jgi:hypothetical protein